MNIPFKPNNEVDIRLNYTTASSSVSLLGANMPSVGGSAIRIYNKSGFDVAIQFGTSGVAAVLTTSIQIPAGAVEVITAPEGTTHLAGIGDGGSGTLCITVGGGL
jgi:hypothetical protein